MPEIKLGSSKNMKNINLGSKEIEEVRLGSVLVWQNNLVPQIVLTTPEKGEYGDLNFPIGVTVASNVSIVFSVRDLDPLDTVVSYSVSGPPGFTDIPTTPISPPANPVEGLTFTIPDTLFPTSGEPTTNNVFTVRVTDQRNKFGEYTITVIGVSVPPPTIVVTQEFGEYEYLTTPNPIGKTARWAITQPQETIDNGYNPQYSFDNINWIDLPATPSTSTPSTFPSSTSTNCGGSSTVTAYCRSVKTGETTAVGDSASSTLKIKPPKPYFPLTGGGGCVYSGYFTALSGGNVIRGFFGSQSCDGVISRAGDDNDGYLSLISDNFYVTSTANVIFTGTAPQTMVVDGRPAPLYSAGERDMGYYVTYTVPSTNGTGIPFSCSGGDIRRTATYLGNVNTVNGISGDLGTTGVGSLLNRGQDYIYTSLSINSPYVSINVSGNGFGDTSYAASFNQVGTTSTRPVYAGYYRLASGGKRGLSGTNRYDRTFRTNEP